MDTMEPVNPMNPNSPITPESMNPGASPSRTIPKGIVSTTDPNARIFRVRPVTLEAL
jgi:hypothetical protein